MFLSVKMGTASPIVPFLALTLLLLSERAKGLNFTLGFTTDMWYGNYYPATAIQIALDTIRSQGALQDHNFR